MNNKIREILERHYSTILTELDEITDVEKCNLCIEINSKDFKCSLK